MACLLQPECNFLHGFFRCKLPVEVVDVEVKVMSIQGAHIFKRDRMTQLIRCMPCTAKLHLHPNIIKKLKTFLEVENKMGPIVPALVSQFRPPLPETNPNIRKADSTEKRRASPKKRFRPATPTPTLACLPLSQTAAAPKAIVASPPFLQATPKPTNGADDAMTVREDTPWPRAGRMSGNLFEERKWVLPKNIFAIEGKKEDATVAKPPPKEELKMGEQPSNQKEEKCGLGPDCPFCKAQKKDVDPPHLQEQIEGQQQKPLPKPQAKRPETLNISKARQQWEEMERLNVKYNLDCFSDSELDSESDEDEQYQYEHGYETLI